jgi:hypothetical protein
MEAYLSKNRQRFKIRSAFYLQMSGFGDFKNECVVKRVRCNYLF